LLRTYRELYQNNASNKSTVLYFHRHRFQATAMIFKNLREAYCIQYHICSNT